MCGVVSAMVFLCMCRRLDLISIQMCLRPLVQPSHAASRSMPSWVPQYQLHQLLLSCLVSRLHWCLRLPSVPLMGCLLWVLSGVCRLPKAPDREVNPSYTIRLTASSACLPLLHWITNHCCHHPRSQRQHTSLLLSLLYYFYHGRLRNRHSGRHCGCSRP